MSMKRRIEFYAELGNYGRGVGLHVLRRSEDRLVAAKPLDFEEIPDELTTEHRLPSVFFDMASAQQLMDELWRCGLRPSEGTGSAGALAATERHLKDMQDISRKLMDRVMQDMISPAPPPFGDVIR